MGLAENSGVRPPVAGVQRYMLLYTLGVDFGSLDAPCELCGNRVGDVSAHADCCKGTGGNRTTRHGSIKYTAGMLLQQALRKLRG